MNNILKRGFGKLQSIITRGFGKTLIIIVDKTVPDIGATVKPSRIWNSFSRYIKTKHISLCRPWDDDCKKEIFCDAVLVHPDSVVEVRKAALLSKKYEEVIVYKIDEVTLLD